MNVDMNICITLRSGINPNCFVPKLSHLDLYQLAASRWLPIVRRGQAYVQATSIADSAGPVGQTAIYSQHELILLTAAHPMFSL